MILVSLFGFHYIIGSSWLFLWYLSTTSILLCFYQCYVFYSEQYFTLTIDMISAVLHLITAWKRVPTSILLYYLVLTAGYSIIMSCFLCFFSINGIIAEFIQHYSFSWLPLLMSILHVILSATPFSTLTWKGIPETLS